MADLADREFADEVAVRVVDLFEVVHVGHDDAEGLLPRSRRRQGTLELLVEAGLREEAGEVVLVERSVQPIVELRPQRVGLGVLDDALAEGEPVPVSQGASRDQRLAVELRPARRIQRLTK